MEYRGGNTPGGSNAWQLQNDIGARHCGLELIGRKLHTYGPTYMSRLPPGIWKAEHYGHLLSYIGCCSGSLLGPRANSYLLSISSSANVVRWEPEVG